VLRLQAEVARSIARGIQVELTPDERADCGNEPAAAQLVDISRHSRGLK
jgi:hypothetical protein